MTPWSPCPRCTHSMAVHRLVADKVGYRCQVFVFEAQGQPVDGANVPMQEGPDVGGQDRAIGRLRMRLAIAIPLAIVIVLLMWQLYAAISIAIMATL